MRGNETESKRGELPIALSIGGVPIGGAREVEEERDGRFWFEGLDVIALVFFAERVGPGGPGSGTMVRDVCVTDRRRRRTLHASEAAISHFSSGSGDLELSAHFIDTQT